MTQWVDFRRKTIQAPFYYTSAAEVAAGKSFDFNCLPFIDPECYLAANVHEYVERWREIGATEEVLAWISNGVDVTKYFRPFKGNFKGKSYNSVSPPPMYFYFPNASTCIGHENFSVEYLTERVSNDPMSVWGQVGEMHLFHVGDTSSKALYQGGE